MRIQFSKLKISLLLRSAGSFCTFVLALITFQIEAADSPLSADYGPGARVVIVRDPEATQAFNPIPEKIQVMVDRGITNLTRKATAVDGWRSLVSTQDIVGIKVFSVPGPKSGTRPAVVAAVVQGLLGAGVPPKHIVIWDKQIADLKQSGFVDMAKKYGIRVAGSAQVGYDDKVFYEMALLGNLVWGDHEFGKEAPGVGRKSFVSKLVTRDITKIINISPLLNHNLAGVSGNLYSLATGSVDNIVRFESDPDRLASAVPDIFNLPVLSDHVVLNITDALICQYEGGERGLLHYSAVMDELRFSKDPVALDVLSLKDLDRERKATSAPAEKQNIDLYENASLIRLGVSDVKRIRVDRITAPPTTQSRNESLPSSPSGQGSSTP